MKSPGTSWFWIAAAFIAGAVVCLVPGRVEAGWTDEYSYQDFFDTQKAERDSYVHSIFWPQGAFPPSEEAYLYYFDSDGLQELGFGDYNDDPALLVYRFPIGSEKLVGPVHGELWIEVRFPYGAEGYLRYEFSEDGINWSNPEQLQSGRNTIMMESIRGTCYVRFRGTKVLIDDLEVNLESYPADKKVPGGYSTIQEAINAASDGDIIEVAPGPPYSGPGNWDIDFQGKAITVRSEAGPEYTTLDCSGQGHRGFYFHRGEGPDSILRGFTIEGAVIPGSAIPSDFGGWRYSRKFGHS